MCRRQSVERDEIPLFKTHIPALYVRLANYVRKEPEVSFSSFVLKKFAVPDKKFVTFSMKRHFAQTPVFLNTFACMQRLVSLRRRKRRSTTAQATYERNLFKQFKLWLNVVDKFRVAWMPHLLRLLWWSFGTSVWYCLSVFDWSYNRGRRVERGYR